MLGVSGLPPALALALVSAAGAPPVRLLSSCFDVLLLLWLWLLLPLAPLLVFLRPLLWLD